MTSTATILITLPLNTLMKKSQTEVLRVLLGIMILKRTDFQNKTKKMMKNCT
jgi:hypothetical protein